MPLIQVTLSESEDALIAEAAKKNRRSKREQLAFSAIEHAKSIVPDFVHTGAPKKPANHGK